MAENVWSGGREGLVQQMAQNLGTGYGKAQKMAAGTQGAALRKYQQRLDTPVQDTLESALARRQFGRFSKDALGGAARRAQAMGIGGSGVQYSDPMYRQMMQQGFNTQLSLENALQRRKDYNAKESFVSGENWLGGKAGVVRGVQQGRLGAAMRLLQAETQRKNARQQEKAKQTDMAVQGGLLGASLISGGLPWVLGGGGVGIGGLGAGWLSKALGGTGSLAAAQREAGALL